MAELRSQGGNIVNCINSPAESIYEDLPGLVERLKQGRSPLNYPLLHQVGMDNSLIYSSQSHLSYVFHVGCQRHWLMTRLRTITTTVGSADASPARYEEARMLIARGPKSARVSLRTCHSNFGFPIS
jgi:hypothetical protein